jgi:hypothetical protein
MSRKAFAWAGVHLSQRITGIPEVLPPLASGLQAQMTINNLAVAPRQNGDFDSEFANAAAHAGHRRVAHSGIPGVEQQPINVPNLNLPGLDRRFLRKHSSPR